MVEVHPPPARSRLVVNGSNAALWMGLALCASLGLAGLVFAVLGSGKRGTDVALQMSARLSFLLFWPAYAGSALTALFGATFQPLKRHARELGLAFSAALLVHISLVAWRSYIGFTPGRETFIFFGVAVLCTYLMALFSVARLHQMLGPKGWSLLNIVALNYIAYAFTVDFWWPSLLDNVKHLIAYFPFAVLSVAGPVLRLAAFIQRIVHSRTASTKPSS